MQAEVQELHSRKNNVPALSSWNSSSQQKTFAARKAFTIFVLLAGAFIVAGAALASSNLIKGLRASDETRILDSRYLQVISALQHKRLSSQNLIPSLSFPIASEGTVHKSSGHAG